MDDAHEVRADLRSYALRRCIRFYTALLILAITWTAAQLAGDFAARNIYRGGGFLLLVIAGVEVSSMIVMREMAAARARLGGGPETPMWALAQGPWPSLAAAALFGLLSVWFFVLSS